MHRYLPWAREVVAGTGNSIMPQIKQEIYPQISQTLAPAASAGVAQIWTEEKRFSADDADAVEEEIFIYKIFPIKTSLPGEFFFVLFQSNLLF
ncbi:MAG TPA: hypothetical protein VFF68_00325 [Anaerolineaceae bacterium]|nr:hypothetical protein [Anaerolineaceae bacterium]